VRYFKTLAIAAFFLSLLLNFQLWGEQSAHVAFLNGETVGPLGRIHLSLAHWISKLWIVTVPLAVTGAVLVAKRRAKQGPTQGEPVPSWPVPDPANEEGYVRSCSEAVFSEEKEERTFRSDPAFQGVLDPLNSQQYAAAIKAAESLLSRFSDFDLPYKWLASAYRSTNQLQQSHDVLVRGLARAKRKAVLLTDMGETEWRMGNIHQAVYCWCQALHYTSLSLIEPH
jgi:tetratricopeptide (TPR) repeat protein